MRFVVARVLSVSLAGLIAVVPNRVAAENNGASSGKDLVHQLNQAFEEVYNRVSPAVVVIDVSKSAAASGGTNNPFEGFDFFFKGPKGDEGSEQPDQSEGSGFIIRPDGYILTNNHVVDGADRIKVKLKDGQLLTAKVIGTDDRTDIAVIKVQASNLPVVELANSDDVKVGQLVCAIGAPYKFEYSFTTGVVSAKGRNELLADKYEDYIQTDAAINPGNSGGPLCDIDCKVIGMNTLIHGLNRGLGFAISSNLAKQVSDQLISSGRIVRPWLGIIIESLTEQNRGDLFKGIDKGVLVRTIQADTPAAKSDLRPADVITDVDGVPVASAKELQREILKKKVGDQVSLGIWRSGKKVTIPVKTEELPAENSQASITPNPVPSPESSNTSFGVEVQEVTPELSKELALKSNSGVVVTDVVPNSPAAVADIQPGDVITEVDRTAVLNLEAFQKALAEEKGKTSLLLLLDRKGIKTYSIVKTGK